jgi:CheY-like chemotaxis protein
LAHVAVIVHERLGNWARQLRSRLHNLPVRWYETRTAADLDRVLTGLARPVVLLDLANRRTAGLQDLALILHKASDARVLVLDADALDEVRSLARELGATHVLSGFAPPPLIAEVMARWVALAHGRIEREGWYRRPDPDPTTEPWSFLSEYLGDPKSAPRPQDCDDLEGASKSSGALHAGGLLR